MKVTMVVQGSDRDGEGAMDTSGDEYITQSSDTEVDSVVAVESNNTAGDDAMEDDTETSQQPRSHLHQPLRGTHEELLEFLRLRLKMALMCSSNSLTHLACNVRLVDALNFDDVVDCIIRNILFRDYYRQLHQQLENRDLSPSESSRTANSSTSIHQNEQVRTIRETMPSQQVSDPVEGPADTEINIVEQAQEAWECLATVQQLVAPSSRASYGPNETITFPSQLSVDCLCELIIQAVTAGAILGFEATVQNIQNVEVC